MSEEWDELSGVCPCFRDWIVTENGRMKLGPGMVVTAEIHTGRRRIIDYLLSPLARKVDGSLHER
jgi:hemolysin D